jgi:hypothetical protein
VQKVNIKSPLIVGALRRVMEKTDLSRLSTAAFVGVSAASERAGAEGKAEAKERVAPAAAEAKDGAKGAAAPPAAAAGAGAVESTRRVAVRGWANGCR